MLSRSEAEPVIVYLVLVGNEAGVVGGWSAEFWGMGDSFGHGREIGLSIAHMFWVDQSGVLFPDCAKMKEADIKAP